MAPPSHPPRYVAIVWPASAAREASALKDRLRRAHPAWIAATNLQGLFVFASGERPPTFAAHRLERDRGVILGALFSRGGEGPVGAARAPAQPCVIDAATARLIAGSAGSALISSFWGRYIAFIRDGDKGATVIIRDPSGALPCFAARVDGVHLYFSDVEAAASVLAAPVRADELGLVRRLIAPEVVDGKTALAGIEEVLAGERRTHAGGEVKRDLAWNVGALARDPIEDQAAAARALHEAVRSAVDQQASLYPSIVHSLSGGLDSSIVLTLLARSTARPRVAAFTYYSPDNEGDERGYARLAAASAGSTLVEAPLNADECRGAAMIDEWLDVPLSPSPTGRIFGARMDRLRVRLAEETGAAAFFSGEGGDHVFFKQATTLGAADYVRRHGLDRAFGARVREAAVLADAPLAAAMRSAFEFGVLRRRARLSPALLAVTFIRQDAIDAARRRASPSIWAEAERLAPPGKARHLAAVRLALHRPPAFGLAATGDVVHPLLSQPVVELCLRIPVYTLGLDGRERGLARRAFGELLPPEIAARTAKGGTSRRFVALYRDNFRSLREFLLGGALGRAAFADRKALEMLVTQDAADQEDALVPLFLALTGEAWLRRLAAAPRRGD